MTASLKLLIAFYAWSIIRHMGLLFRRAAPTRILLGAVGLRPSHATLLALIIVADAVAVASVVRPWRYGLFVCFVPILLGALETASAWGLAFAYPAISRSSWAAKHRLEGGDADDALLDMVGSRETHVWILVLSLFLSAFWSGIVHINRVHLLPPAVAA